MSAENPTVAAHAVTPNVLALDELALIGLIYARETATALVRTARGDIVKLATGDRLGTKTVVAISDDSLILAAANGAQTVLQMPS